jgi:hypothetical protein
MGQTKVSHAEIAWRPYVRLLFAAAIVIHRPLALYKINFVQHAEGEIEAVFSLFLVVTAASIVSTVF